MATQQTDPVTVEHEVAQILIRLDREIFDLQMRCKDSFVREMLATARAQLSAVAREKRTEFVRY